MAGQQPSVGRIVHYVSHGTPVRADGSQAFASQCRAAIITEVGDGNRVGLTAINPTGLFFHPLAAGGCDLDDRDNEIYTAGTERRPYHGGTWHWPERV